MGAMAKPRDEDRGDKGGVRMSAFDIDFFELSAGDCALLSDAASGVSFIRACSQSPEYFRRDPQATDIQLLRRQTHRRDVYRQNEIFVSTETLCLNKPILENNS